MANKHHSNLVYEWLNLKGVSMSKRLHSGHDLYGSPVVLKLCNDLTLIHFISHVLSLISYHPFLSFDIMKVFFSISGKNRKKIFYTQIEYKVGILKGYSDPFTIYSSLHNCSDIFLNI